MAPGLISSLFGDPQKKLRQQLMKLQSPAYQGQLTNQFYQQALGGPAYSQAQGQIAAGANQAGADVARALGARGLGTSGVGSIVPALQSSLVGSNLAGLKTQAYQGAQNQAQNAIQGQIQALTGTQGPGRTQQLFGTGFEALIPVLQRLLQQQGGGGMNPFLLQNRFSGG